MSDIRLPNGQYSLLVTPVGKDGITQFVTPVNPDGTIVTGGGGGSSVSLTTTGTSGTATLVGSALNVPNYTLTNGYILNGVANFTQSTNPTTRIGGGALVVGDKLYRTDLRVDAVWNGTYWLGVRQLYGGNANSLSSASQFGRVFIPWYSTTRYFLHLIQWQYERTTGLSDASNFYTVNWTAARNDGVNIGSILGSMTTTTPSGVGNVVINQALTAITATPYTGVSATSVATGTPGGFRYNFECIVSEIIT